jgi:hypothetical protein
MSIHGLIPSACEIILSNILIKPQICLLKKILRTLKVVKILEEQSNQIFFVNDVTRQHNGLICELTLHIFPGLVYLRPVL